MTNEELAIEFSNPAHVAVEIIDGNGEEIENEFKHRIDLFTEGGTYSVRVLSTSLTQLDLDNPHAGLRYALAVVLERS